MSFLEKLQVAKVEAVAHATADAWRLRLERVRGRVDGDGLERVSTQTLLDMLEVPQRSRTAGTYRRLAKLMVELGWTAVRVRDLTRGGYTEQVRGYVRDRRNRATLRMRAYRARSLLAPGNAVGILHQVQYSAR